MNPVRTRADGRGTPDLAGRPKIEGAVADEQVTRRAGWPALSGCSAHQVIGGAVADVLARVERS